MKDRFNFWLDLDIYKSDNPSNISEEDKYKNMIFEGIASDSSIDMEDESLDPSGFVLDYFLNNGYFNLDHLPTRSPVNKSRFWIGEPIDAKILDGNKFYVKGKLWERSPEARAFWDKCLEMKESGSKRKPGMSIEGKALERDKKNKNKITKALITNVALTFNPVNGNSYMDILKGIQKSDFVDYEFEDSNEFDNSSILEYDRDGYHIKIDKNFKVIATPINISKELSYFYKQFKNKVINEEVLNKCIDKLGNKFGF